MSKQQSKQVFNAGNTALSGFQSEGATNNNQLQGVLGNYQSNSNSLYSPITSGYSSLSASGGGYNPTDVSTIEGTYNDLSSGGISPQQLQAMTGQAQQTAASAYKTGEQQLENNIASTGGYGFSGAAEANLARQGSQAASSATNNLLSSLVAQQSQNKIAGASGLNTLNQGMTANQLAALGGQSNIYNTNVNASTNTLQQILQNYQTTGTLTNNDLQTLAKIGAENGWGSNLSNFIQMGAGASAGILGALNGR